MLIMIVQLIDITNYLLIFLIFLLPVENYI
jgi:hypothetical protein